MLMRLRYVCSETRYPARYNLDFTENCSGSDSQLVSCDNCAGEGGFYFPEDERSLERFEPCPACGGSGWLPGDPPSLTLSDLEERAP